MGNAEIERYLKRWSLRVDGDCLETPTSWIQPVLRLNTPAILKLLKHSSDENGAVALLEYCDGRGAVSLFEADVNAHLLERATGTRSLVDMAISGHDADTAQVLADTMKTLHERAG